MRRAPGLPYPPPDLNRHALRALAPKASASSNSARGASTARAAQQEQYPTRVATRLTRFLVEVEVVHDFPVDASQNV